MNLEALKLELIKKINLCEDIEILIRIKNILDHSTLSTANESQTVYQKTEKVLVFNEWQQARIDKALEQVRNGEVLTDEEAEKEIQEWFREQEKLFGQ